MEQERIRMMDYMIHFTTTQPHLKFEVYPVIDWTHSSTGNVGYSYIDKENQPDVIEIFEEGKSLMKMQGSFCWRGVWEGRLYFTDEEYFGEDIAELSELYNHHIVKWCKNFIKNRDKRTDYDD